MNEHYHYKVVGDGVVTGDAGGMNLARSQENTVSSNTVSRNKPALERFFDRVYIHESGCWEWKGAYTGPGSAYPGFRGEQSVWVYAHRWIYGKMRGPIPHGFVIHHTCENGPKRKGGCINPFHMLALTPSEHSRVHWRMRKMREAQRAA